MEILNVILLLFIIACSIAVALNKNLLSSVIIFMAQGLAVSVVWMLLQSPDLAITEAAVGAGVSSILLFAALKKIDAIRKKEEKAHEQTKA
ncbi:MAG: DUF4040 domain-containing protein [Clostridia bacterium]|nr:DUF4040 domain-containing protein [Clostridia bacterium]